MPQLFAVPGPMTINDSKQCRYWGADSQPFAAGDQLLYYVFAGWDVSDQVLQEVHWLGEGRHTVIYHFTLSRGSRHMAMRVLGTPYVEQLLLECELEVVPMAHETGDHGVDTPYRRPAYRIRFDVDAVHTETPSAD